MTTSQIPTRELNNGTRIPQVGFGVYLVEQEDAQRVVEEAFEVGYRHIDTAAIYGNEAEVGRAIAASGLARDEIWLTTKLWNADQAGAPAAFQRSLDRLGLDRVDLYLVHWPAPAHDTYVTAWKSLIEIQESGRARAIGVSNFTEEHLARIIDETGVTPAVDQVELHVDFQQAELRDVHERLGIVTEAWGPLGQGRINSSPVLADIAAAHGKSVAQVILRWHVQLGNVVFPKSTHRDRIEENIDLFDFELNASEMESLAALDRGEAGRAGGHPLKVK